ncbi:MAG: hypothetical protein QOJ63_3737 [Solirubrobacteraceae bacterium]|nr:hypothetical protein [Solirubrobacteraceae bacterium]
MRTRIALRDPREAGADDRFGRAGDDPPEREAAGGSGRRQIGQFWMKRLWRQKLGGTTSKSRRESGATLTGRHAFQSHHATLRRDWIAVPYRSPIRLAVALATLGCVAAPAAHASWTVPQAITDPAAANVHAAGNDRGSEAFAWKVTSRRFVSLRSQSGLASSVRARIRLPDGRLGRVQTISSTREIVANPQIGVADSGDATAVWTQAGRHLRIMAAFRPHGGRFGTPFELGRSTHFTDAKPQLVVGRLGDAVVAWNQGRHVEVVRRAANAVCVPRRARDCFRAPLSLRAGTDQTVALGPLGSAYVAWAADVRGGGELHTRLRMAVIRRSGRLTGDHAISRAADGDASQPSIAVRRDATADLAWRASLPAGGEQNDAAPILAAVSTPVEVTSQPRAVSLLRGERPTVRVDAQGEAVLAWDQFDSTPQNPDGSEIAVAVRPAGADTFGPAATITPANVTASGSSLAVDATGSAYLVYSAFGGDLSTPGASPLGLSHVRPAGGAFGPPLALPDGFGGATVFSAGAKVTAVSGGGSAGRWLVSDWTP